ncbi:MAG: DUF2764 domain-containing protein [Bacteroidales bacterium]|jgi:hypothetical protein|nr:DUF2764 domain-containing protein [Bacteroidales bacterium]
MKYYCLIAGLPDMGIDDRRPVFDMAAFREILRPQLSGKDNRLIDLFYLKFDNRNLLRYLTDKNIPFDGRGNLSRDEMEECLRQIEEAEEPENKYFPPYYKTFIEEYRSTTAEPVQWENRMAELYYSRAMRCGNRFVSEWFGFNLNLNNILAAYAARKYRMETEVVGDNEVAQSIKASGQRDLGLTGVVDNMDELQRIAEERDLFEREKKIDLLQWKWIEENTFFAYFTIERIFACLLKLEIIERWAVLDREEGKRVFGKLIDDLKNTVINESKLTHAS